VNLKLRKRVLYIEMVSKKYVVGSCVLFSVSFVHIVYLNKYPDLPWKMNWECNSPYWDGNSTSTAQSAKETNCQGMVKAC
jgi:hypothetical protein